MTEVEARALLRNPSLSGIEAWIAEQKWQVVPGGWTVRELQGWRIRLVQVPEGLQLRATAPNGRAPAVWQVSRP